MHPTNKWTYFVAWKVVCGALERVRPVGDSVGERSEHRTSPMHVGTHSRRVVVVCHQHLLEHFTAFRQQGEVFETPTKVVDDFYVLARDGVLQNLHVQVVCWCGTREDFVSDHERRCVRTTKRAQQQREHHEHGDHLMVAVAVVVMSVVDVFDGKARPATCVG